MKEVKAKEAKGGSRAPRSELPVFGYSNRPRGSNTWKRKEKNKKEGGPQRLDFFPVERRGDRRGKESTH